MIECLSYHTACFSLPDVDICRPDLHYCKPICSFRHTGNLCPLLNTPTINTIGHPNFTITACPPSLGHLVKTKILVCIQGTSRQGAQQGCKSQHRNEDNRNIMQDLNVPNFEMNTIFEHHQGSIVNYKAHSLTSTCDHY